MERLKMTTITEVLAFIAGILKAIIARCLFVVYGFVAVWRVTAALSNEYYWLLLLTLCPLALETAYTLIKRQGKGQKWITPNVLFFLYCTVPCIWLLELRLLHDRLSDTTDSASNTTSESTSDDSSETIPISIHLSHETWTLALEQTLIFILVLAKWIAPKGDLSLDQLSQLLLVNIAAGADIIELMEVFSEDAVSKNEQLVYIVMAVWSWSLLQFTLVLTATKEMPNLKEDEDDEEAKDDMIVGAENGRAVQVEDNGNLLNVPGMTPNGNNESQVIEIDDESQDEENAEGLKKVHDELRADEEVAACLQGRRCFDCFCCYNEIWGMTMSIFFQDGPFLILRMFILFYYNVLTHMNVFFTFKNIFVIVLLVNRIRVVVKEDRKGWKETMDKAAVKRRLEKDKDRIARGLPPKTKELRNNQNSPPESPMRRRWMNWRS